MGELNMAIIQMKISELVSRGENIRTMLRPISKLETGPAWERKSAPGGIIIAVHDGVNPTSDYRDYRFSTFVQNFQAMYFELWRRTEEDEQSWYLEKAYLSIYRLINNARFAKTLYAQRKLREFDEDQQKKARILYRLAGQATN
jgi:hypothetical protein